MKRKLLTSITVQFLIDDFCKGEIGDHNVKDKLTKNEALDYLNKSFGNDFAYVLEELKNYMDEDFVEEEEDPNWLITQRIKMNELLKEE